MSEIRFDGKTAIVTGAGGGLAVATHSNLRAAVPMLSSTTSAARLTVPVAILKLQKRSSKR